MIPFSTRHTEEGLLSGFMTKDFRFGDYNEDGNNQEIAGADVIIWIYILSTLLTIMKMVIINYHINILSPHFCQISLFHSTLIFKTNAFGFCWHWYDYQICSSNFFLSKIGKWREQSSGGEDGFLSGVELPGLLPDGCH